MPGRDGLAAAAELAAAAARVPGARSSPRSAGRATCAGRSARGASGFLLKDAPATELAAAIRRVVAGERVVDPGLAAAALSRGRQPADRRASATCSSAARAQPTVADIAGALFLSPGTVRNYLSSAMQKLGARDPRRGGPDRRRARLAVSARRGPGGPGGGLAGS